MGCFYVAEKSVGKVCIILKFRKRKLQPLICLLIWSICLGLFCVMWDGLEYREKSSDQDLYNRHEIKKNESLKGNNISNYIELVQMPPEIAFENIRVMITNKKNNSIFFDWEDYDEVKKKIEEKGYRGEIIYKEASDRENGFVIINELPLEEYLYGVVPSEMPASYPMEALKAQAICARTYAVIYMMNPAYPDYEAHVNDTTSFQVYHNIEEQERTNRAVDETAGMLLMREDGQNLVETFYYSTSCGQTCEASTNGEFKEYISRSYNGDFEAEESWYRWSCKIDHIDKAAMLQRMQKRYEVNHDHVLTMTGKDCYESLPVKELGTIRELFVSKRAEKGVAEELIISTDKNTYIIIGEYNIRYVLNDADAKIVKQDGNMVSMATLLPSAFISLDAIKDDGQVTGYEIMGGGYGHGIGMSQNGAKGMANAGYSTEDILEYFYPGSDVLKNF